MRREDRLSLLEKLLAAPQTLARMFAVPMSLRLLSDYDAVVAEARAALGQSLAPDAVPLILDGCEIAWQQVAIAQQAFLIATGKDDIDRSAAHEAQRKAVADDVGNQPAKPTRKPKPPTPFVHHPSIFDNPTRA